MELDNKAIEELVATALAEDIGRGDITTDAVVPREAGGRARIEARQDLVVAGLSLARACFESIAYEPIEWQAKVEDSDHVASGDVLVFIEGSLRTILTAERSALNLLGHLSGIATTTAALVAQVEGLHARIVDTRKTTPGLRMVEKYAVRMGGGSNHRFGLDDGVLIKDNHIAAVGGITPAVQRARAAAPHTVTIEVEVADIGGLDEAIAAGADVVMLDNMSPDEVRAAVEHAAGVVTLEVSGGITSGNVRAYAETGVDLISIGAITHSAPNADVALEMEVQG